MEWFTKSFRKHFLKQKDDGRWALGSGVGLVLIVLVFGGGLFLIWPAKQPTPEIPAGKVSLGGVDRAIRGATSVEQVERKQTTAERSSRGVKNESTPPSPAGESEKPTEHPTVEEKETSQQSDSSGDDDVFGSVAEDAVKAPPPPPEKPNSEKPVENPNPNPSMIGQSRFVPHRPQGPRANTNPQNGRGTADAPQPGTGSATGAVIIYEGDEASATPEKAEPAPTGFTSGDFLPRGTEIPLYILDTVQTDDQETLITFGVAEPIKFQGRYVLPFGTRMLGVAAPARKGTRISFNVETILYPDGKELPISGLVKGMDGHSGVPAYYIRNGELPIELATASGAFTKAYLDTLAQYQQQRFQLQLGSNAALSTANPTVDGTQAAIQAGSQSVQELITKHVDELTARYAPYLTVIAGTQCKLVLRSAVDLTRAKENGSADDHREKPPGFEDNVFRPDGSLIRTAGQNNVGDPNALVKQILSSQIPGLGQGAERRASVPASQQTIPVP